MMMRRLNPYKVAPAAMQPMIAMEDYLKGCGLDPILAELVRTRASQLNGCAYCLYTHAKDARDLGETDERLLLLSAWKESPLYSEKERAALAWTEALTLLPDTAAPDGEWEALAPHFSEEERVKLTLLITTINAWNRIAVGFRYVH